MRCPFSSIHLAISFSFLFYLEEEDSVIYVFISAANFFPNKVPVGRKSISVESDFVMDRQDLPPAKSGSPWAGSAFCRHFLCQCDAVEEKVSGLRFFLGGRQTSSLSIDPLMRQHGRVQIKRRQRGKRLKIQRRRHCRWRCSF